ncbi:MAG: carbohydrate kinase family protein [Clostridia bacterium]|nr:carbohydrate kinase family protein [Clostridia bacterium]
MASNFLTVGRAYMAENFYVSAMPPADRMTVGKAYARYPDGSGINTAVALAKLGVKSCVLAKVGNDIFADNLEQRLEEYGVYSPLLLKATKSQTGVCATILENLGVSRKIVMEGANRTLDDNDIDHAYEVTKPNYIILNADIPSESVKYAISLADDIGAKVMLSLCGEFSLGVYLEELCSVEILVIDSLNAKRRTDITPGDVPTNLKLCSILSEMINAKYYVLRCPDGSCFVYNGKYYYVVPTYDIETLDATASIESFNASLLLKYLSTKDIKAACEFAVLCEVITCQKLGGPGSLPTFKQIKDFISENQLDERLIK